MQLRRGPVRRDSDVHPGEPSFTPLTTGCGRPFHAHDLLAAGLYERLGYETVGVIDGCPAGSAVRWFRKDL
jgi:hypothetical protein